MKNSQSMAAPSCRGPQRGASLVVSLVALLAFGVAAVATLRAADTVTLVAGNLGFQASASRATELAMEVAIDQLKAVAKDDRGTNRSAANYWSSLESANLAPSAARLSSSTPNAVIDTLTGHRAYYVTERMCSVTGSATTTGCVAEGAQTVYRVTALAIGPRNASQTAQTFLTLGDPADPCSILMQGPVTVSGESWQYGTVSCYHSNSSIHVSGAARTAGLEISAVGSATYGGGGMPVTRSPNEPARTLPAVTPADHRPHATRIFTSSGAIIAPDGSTPPLNAFTLAWKRSSGIWTLDADFKSSCPPAGLYYFEGNVEIPTTIGDGVSKACTLSIVSTQSMKISGAVSLQNYRSGSAPKATDDAFIVAGGDLELPGSSFYLDGTVKQALIGAGSELKVNGEITAEAALVAHNRPLPSGAQNWVSENTVSGTLTQTYHGGSGAVAGTTASRLRWRSLMP